MGDRYDVTLSLEVVVEVARIAAWWRENRPHAPRLFQNELESALLLIAAHPEIGQRARSKRVGDAHVVTLHRSGYRVFYQVRLQTREVLVVHVRHGKRRALRLR